MILHISLLAVHWGSLGITFDPLYIPPRPSKLYNLKV